MSAGPAMQRELGGRYVLETPLGSGGMADVFRAHDTVLDRAVAVKVFRLDENAAQTIARSRNEIALAARLQHPGLVAVYDTGVEAVDGARARPFLVMEHIDGCTLRAAIAAGTLSAADVEAIGRQAAEALDYLHRRGIVHRDVKPANVLLRRDLDGRPQVKITDFGVARSLDAEPLTETGTTVGTANYLSPEQVAGEGVAGAADVYALGLVLLECLTGVVAYPGSGVEAALARLHRDPVVPASVGPAWAALLSAMTARVASQRPSAAQVAVELGGKAETVTTLPLSTAADERFTAVLPVVRTEGRVSRGAVALGALVAAAAAVLAVGVATAGDATTGQPALPPASTPAVHTPTASPVQHTSAQVVMSRSIAPPAPRPAPHQHHHGHGSGD